MKTDVEAGLPLRLRECIADDTVSAFARRCGMAEATIRSYLDGKKPVYDKLVKIADAAGVTVDWLATGREPKYRSQARQAAQDQPQSSLDTLAAPHARRWQKIMELVESMPEQEAAAFLEEAFARARDKAETAELKRAVQTLTAALKKIS
jgi:transcriptional regulator with XRE-family HTH domain